jgi:peptidoglycan/xylan/chitin deacetylase (PgdA/CDA1 family)
VFARREFITALGAMSVLVAARPALARAPFAWPGGKRGAVSLTYDDGLDSQLANVVPALDAMGLKGAFFLTEENMDARLADWVAVARNGHEIGDHTVSHPCKLSKYTAAAFHDQELAPMERYLDDNFGAGRPRDYAYPCGFVKLGKGSKEDRLTRYRSLMDATFAAARIVDGDPNDPRLVVHDRYQLHAFEPTYVKDDPQAGFDYLAKAVARGGWAILVFHDVLEKRVGDGDTSIAVHQAILDAVAKAPVWCAPMATVFDYIAQAEGRPV